VDTVDIAFAGLARQADLIRSGEVSSRELVELYLARIERIEPQLNSYRVVLADRALAEADEADARRSEDDARPLLGVPIALKDNVDIAGEVTTHGTSAYGRPATADAEIVKRLRAAGAVVLGKTLMPELAIFPWTESATFGVTRNPWDLGVTTGGSSGGSAAAVAAGLAAAALASDGGGSIRIPAACCGLYGLKPQRGRVSLMPYREHWHGLSVLGSVTRSVLDTALWLDVVAGRADGDAEAARQPATSFVEAAKTKPGKLRVAVSTATGPPPVKVRPEVEQAVEQMAELLRLLGHTVERRDPPYGFLLPHFMPRWLRGIYEDASALPHPERLERRVRRLRCRRQTDETGPRRPLACARGATRGSHEQLLLRHRRAADADNPAAALAAAAFRGTQRDRCHARGVRHRPLHDPLEPHGSTRGVRAGRLQRRRDSAGGPSGRTPARRGDIAVAERPARGRAAVGGPAPAAC